MEKFFILIGESKNQILPRNRILMEFQGSLEVELFGDKESLDNP